jgi:hypothetical protein
VATKIPPHIRYVLGIDPGKMTGLSSINLRNGQIDHRELGFEQTCKYIEIIASEYGDALQIVIESFIITVNTAKNTHAPWSLELIGVARWFSLSLTGNDLIVQKQSAVKNMVTDNRLEALGCLWRGKGHAQDGARHMFFYLITRGWWDSRLDSTV